jgi:predicted nucleotidyltransferase
VTSVLPSQILARSKKELLKIAEKYKKLGIHNLRVFGSVARGDDTDQSDIDFLIDVDSDVSLLKICALYCELKDMLNIKIHIIPSRSIPNYLRQKILALFINCKILKQTLRV